MQETKEELQMRQFSGFREDNEDVAGYAGEVQQKVRGFSVKEMITGRIVSKCNSNECKVNDYVNKTNLLQNESESVEHRSKESIVWEVQSEAMKYFWASSN